MLTFDQSTHVYTWDKVRVPHITGILRDALGDPFKHVHLDDLAYAQARGRAVHMACELDDAGDLQESSVAAEIVEYVRAWRDFRRMWPFRVLASERPMYSTYGYAGTPDRVIETAGPNSFRAVVELKTGAPGIYAELQTAAQAQLVREDFKTDDPPRRFVMRLSANGKPHLDECKRPSDWRDFLSCLNVSRIRERIAA